MGEARQDIEIDAQPGGQPLSMLVVDDSAVTRQRIRACLAKAGHVVREAENGVLGLAAAKCEDFDLVVVDLHMPAMDGLTMVEQMRRAPRNESTPVVVLTTEPSRKMIAQGRAVGVSAWLLKPVNEQALLQTVHTLIAKIASAADR